jgi:hypothetical protein
MRKKITIVAACASILGVLGMAILPIAAHADTQNETVVVTVTESVAGGGGCDTVAQASIAANSENTTSLNCTTAPSTNSAKGLTVAIKDADSTLSLTPAGTGPTYTPTGTETAPAFIPTIGSAAATLSTNSWGWKASLDNSSGTGTNLALDTSTYGTLWQPITGTDVAVASTAGATSGKSITFNFGVNVGPTVPAGVYSDIVTITVTVNP